MSRPTPDERRPLDRPRRARALLALVAMTLVLVCSGSWRARSQGRVDERRALAARMQDGDLVFQRSSSDQASAIAEATGSRFTHVGIAFHRRGELMVLEAVGPVRFTPFRLFVGRGAGGEVAVRRLRDAATRLDARARARLRREGERLIGRPYDLRFEPSDERIYCSELVWKVYERALSVRLGEPQPWTELDLDGPFARRLVRERLGDADARPQGLVITPARMLASEHLVEVP